MGEEERVADLLLAAVAELTTNPAAAADKLTDVAASLAGHDDLDDVQARTHALLAQARLATDDVQGAESAAMTAMRLARRLDDSAGLAEVRDLHERIAAEKDRIRRQALARRQAETLAATGLEELEARATSPLALADALVKHVGALRLRGHIDRAVESARRAVRAADEADAIRERVLARIALAEVAPDAAAQTLAEALALADEASETTLIGLVAKAAELARVELPHQVGPELPRRHT